MVKGRRGETFLVLWYRQMGPEEVNEEDVPHEEVLRSD